MDSDNLIHFAREPGDAHRRALVARAAHVDRAFPVAREWLRRWRPQPMVATPPDCGCAAGRCAVCN